MTMANRLFGVFFTNDDFYSMVIIHIITSEEIYLLITKTLKREFCIFSVGNTDNINCSIYVDVLTLNLVGLNHKIWFRCYKSLCVCKVKSQSHLENLLALIYICIYIYFHWQP